jgi:1,4-alpha-glucan branching enzyme
VPFPIRIHFENSRNISNPHLWQWSEGSSIQRDFAPTGSDAFGPIFDIEVVHSQFYFKFKSGPGTAGPWESDSLKRRYRPQHVEGDTLLPAEIWCRGDRAFVYDVEPRRPEAETSQQFLSRLSFKEGMFIPNTGGHSGLGAHVLADGRVLFGLYHPNAARVFLIGEFNDWQRPGAENEDPSKFIELKLYRGYFGVPNTWLVITDVAQVGHEYKFAVRGGVPSDEKRRSQQYLTDPYARRLGPSFKFNNSVIVDPTAFTWHDAGWRTPDMSQLIIYELSVHGFTEGDPDIDPANRGKFKGITERIADGYFERLGVTALSLMPLSESPSPQGPTTLGYDPSLYFTVERDFGSPDDLRELVDTAHQHGLAMLLDQVFNHTSSGFNPLWQMILEHPDEEGRSGEGGLYFNGTTDWGNRIATEKTDVQNMLIDACMLLLTEYHVDGFRFDATHTNYMDHSLPIRLARKLKDFKPDVLLVAENLPNQSDLNRSGFDGIAQWCDPFHDKIKAMLREGVFQDVHTYSTDRLADIFFFSKSFYAAHTNNVVNYCESHDEHSVSFEVKFTPALDNSSSKERKARLGLFSSLLAMGQPMIYMGQEFQTERPRNIVTVQWPANLDNHGFFQWARRLIKLRKRYPGLKIAGFNPEAEGKFAWVLGPWLDSSRGGGKRLLGWRLKPNSNRNDMMVVMLNFENQNVAVTVDFGLRGTWVKLADIDFVNDVPPGGTNSADQATALQTNDGNFVNFVLPSSGGFLYKFERD